MEGQFFNYPGVFIDCVSSYIDCESVGENLILQKCDKMSRVHKVKETKTKNKSYANEL